MAVFWGVPAQLSWRATRYGWEAYYEPAYDPQKKVNARGFVPGSVAAERFYARITGTGTRYRVAFNDWAKYGVEVDDRKDAIRVVEASFELDKLEGLL